MVILENLLTYHKKFPNLWYTPFLADTVDSVESSQSGLGLDHD